MTAIQFAESHGLKRFVKLMRKPKSYSEEFTIQELDELYKRSFSKNDYGVTEQYCEQALSQFYDEIDESKYDGFRTRQQILYFYVSAMVSNVLHLEAEYRASQDETLLKQAEQKLLRAIEFDTERKKYPNAKIDIGFGDLDEHLIRLIIERDKRLGLYAGVQIDAPNQHNISEKEGVHDRYYWFNVAAAAHYYKTHSINDKALDLYRRLLGYTAETENAIDSIGKTTYLDMIQDMAFLQATPEDTILLRTEFERTKMLFRRDCGNDSLCYYGNLALMGLHIIPKDDSKYYLMQLSQNISRYDTSQTNLYYDIRMISLLMEKPDINSKGRDAAHKWIKDAELLLPQLPCCQSSVQNAVTLSWIQMNFDLTINTLLNSSVDSICMSRFYAQNIWDAVPLYFRTNKDEIQNRLSTMSNEMALYWLNTKNPFIIDQAVYWAIDYSEPPPESIAAIYDNELFKKGLLLRNIDNLKHYLLESSDTTAIYLYNKIQSLKNEREHFQKQVFTDSVLTELTSEIDNKERILYYLNGKYKEQSNYDSITWRSICSQLKENEVTIEFVNYSNRYIDIDHYFAIVLKKGYEYPKLVNLSALIYYSQEEKDNSQKLYQHRLEYAREHNLKVTPPEPHFLEFVGDADEIYRFDGNGTDLYNALWLPLKEYITEGETIYFAPSGILHQLAIEALPYDSTHIMADMFNLVRLSSTREIVTRKDLLHHTTATLYGGIQYDMDAKELLEESKIYESTDILASRGIENDTLNRGTITYLKGTKKEAESINTLLRRNKLQVQLFTSTAANEESFKALSGKRQNILHIATHGFY